MEIKNLTLQAGDSIMEEIRLALLAGDLIGLEDLARRLESASPPPSRGAARRWRDMALRNERLLQAAIRGVKSARLRAREIEAAGRPRTYGADGRVECIAEAQRQPFRRA